MARKIPLDVIEGIVLLIRYKDKLERGDEWEEYSMMRAVNLILPKATEALEQLLQLASTEQIILLFDNGREIPLLRKYGHFPYCVFNFFGKRPRREYYLVKCKESGILAVKIGDGRFRYTVLDRTLQKQECFSPKKDNCWKPCELKGGDFEALYDISTLTEQHFYEGIREFRRGYTCTSSELPILIK